MKKVLLSIALLASGMMYGQGYYYIKKTGIPGTFDWIPTTNGSAKILDKPNNDVLTAAQTIPFNFTFHGNTFTSYKASDNGYITFDGTAASSDATPANLPDANKPQNAIFGFWNDLELKAAPNASFPVGIYTLTTGTAPNRVHMIEWFGLSRKGATISANADVIAFAVRLYEAGGFEILHGSYGGANFKGLVGEQDNGTSATLVTGGTNFTYTAAAGMLAKDVITYVFNSGTQPGWDASVISLNFNSDYGMTPAIPVMGTLANYGKNTITSLDLNYSINGGATVTKNITGLNIAPNGTYNFTGTPYTPTGKGAMNIDVWASNLNGNADELSNNDKLTTSFNVHLKVAPRVSLHEIFTSSTCGPCAPGNANHDNVISDKDPATFAVVKFQQDFPGTGDPYCTSETVGRRSYYAINSIPRMEIDGQWDGNASSFTTNLHNQYQAIPSLVELSAKHNVVGHNVDVYVDVTPLADMPDAKLFIAVCEKLTDQNVATNGETEFYHVVKKMLPNQNGSAVSNMKENTKLTFAKSYTFPGDYRLPSNGQAANRINLSKENSVEGFDDLEVIVWVQDNTTKKVLQAAHSTHWATAVKSATAASGLKAYPNPANNRLTIEFDMKQGGAASLTVVNALGQQVMVSELAALAAGQNIQTLNTSALPNGVYFVNITSNGATTTQRFVVAH